MAPAAARELFVELWEQILLRLPPDDPASLLRASLVCKTWRRIVSCRAFLRRLGELHRAPPLLGFFRNDMGDAGEDGWGFVPATTSAVSIPIPQDMGKNWCVVDCRHGRLLLYSKRELLVWEPITGYRQRVFIPASLSQGDYPFYAAVVCAADGCGHWGCHGGPFRVVLISCHAVGDDETVMSAREYSSETGAWGEQISATISHSGSRDFWSECTSQYYRKPPTLVGNSFYFQCGKPKILKYDLGGQGLALINDPTADYFGYDWCIIMQAENGKLQVAGINDAGSPELHLWSGETNGGGAVRWVHQRIINLANVLPAAVFPLRYSWINLIAFAEGANIIFLETLTDGISEFELKTGQARKVCWRQSGEHSYTYNFSPFTFNSFYAPVSCNEDMGISRKFGAQFVHNAGPSSTQMRVDSQVDSMEMSLASGSSKKHPCQQEFEAFLGAHKEVLLKDTSELHSWLLELQDEGVSELSEDYLMACYVLSKEKYHPAYRSLKGGLQSKLQCLHFIWSQIKQSSKDTSELHGWLLELKDEGVSERSEDYLIACYVLSKEEYHPAYRTLKGGLESKLQYLHFIWSQIKK